MWGVVIGILAIGWGVLEVWAGGALWIIILDIGAGSSLLVVRSLSWVREP